MWKQVLKWVLGILFGGGITITVIFAGGGLFLHETKVPSSSEPAPPPPATGPVFEKNGHWETHRASCHDGAGREANFVLAVLAQEDRWVYGDVDNLESGPVLDKLPSYLAVLPELWNAKELVAVGTASEEGSRASEEARAIRRADNILKVLRPIAGQRPLYRLSLGQHDKGHRGSETSDQRRVILIGIQDREPLMTFLDIKQCLRSKLGVYERFSFNIGDYSAFDFSEV